MSIPEPAWDAANTASPAGHHQAGKGKPSTNSLEKLRAANAECLSMHDDGCDCSMPGSFGRSTAPNAAVAGEILRFGASRISTMHFPTAWSTADHRSIRNRHRIRTGCRRRGAVMERRNLVDPHQRAKLTDRPAR